ncbi:MAG: DeoR/GlpR transcriptional regulator [Firmicutes bacterium]|nr:DeoR/GlpR transcriptional regulator [Bacillota bacterium]
MYQEERLVEIINLLQKKNTLSKQEIIEIFDVSRDTARRDIVRLVNENRAVRTHGGITLASFHSAIPNYNERKIENKSIKEKLAEKAKQYITVHKVAFFDVSTTIACLCSKIPTGLEVYTHSLDNVEILSQKHATNMIGGKYHAKNRYMYGSQTLEELDTIYFDIAFLGAASINADGIYVEEKEDAAIKKKVAKRSACVVVIADHTKFTKQSTYKALDFTEINILTTSQPLPKNVETAIREAGCVLDIVE